MYGFNVGPKLYGSVGRRSVFHVINIYRVLAQLSAAQTRARRLASDLSSDGSVSSRLCCAFGTRADALAPQTRRSVVAAARGPATCAATGDHGARR